MMRSMGARCVFDCAITEVMTPPPRDSRTCLSSSSRITMEGINGSDWLESKLGP
jgi:hypothetical protein